MFNIPVLCCVLSYQHTIYFIILLYILCEAYALCLLHACVYVPVLCALLFRYRYIILCAHSLFYTPCIFVQCAFCQCVHSPAAVCLHRSVCSQVLIKCGFLYTWLIWNIGILRPPACLCNELEDGKQEIDLEWPNHALVVISFCYVPAWGSLTLGPMNIYVIILTIFRFHHDLFFPFQSSMNINTNCM